MTVIVDRGKCDGCGICVELCPGDLMAIDPQTRKAYIRSDSDCWDCMVCVKHCPTGALVTRLPYQIALHKATLVPKMTEDRITWTLIGLDGKQERFEMKRKKA